MAVVCTRNADERRMTFELSAVTDCAKSVYARH